MTIDFYRRVYDEGDIWREESWTAHSAQEAPWDPIVEAHVTCVYMDNRHYPGPNCPHQKTTE